MFMIIIKSRHPFLFPNLVDLWSYRELLYFLVIRDIKVRYRQTAIGIAWAFLQPLTLMVIFSLLFGNLAKIPSDGVPYPIFVFCGLLPWAVFARSLNEATNSLITDQRLITRVYFPRVLIPLSVNLAAIFDFLVSSFLLIVLLLYYEIMPGLEILYLPLFLFLMVITSAGVGLWMSALNVEYRDVAYAIPFLIQLWFFATPVVYPTSLVPNEWQFLYGLNPLAGVVSGFRWALLGSGDGISVTLAVSVATSLLIFLTGLVWFNYRERSFVDSLGSAGR